MPSLWEEFRESTAPPVLAVLLRSGGEGAVPRQWVVGEVWLAWNGADAGRDRRDARRGEGEWVDSHAAGEGFVMMPDLSQLTERQREVMAYITDQVVNGRTPTMREIMKEFGFAGLNSVACHLRALIKKGHLQQGKGSRSLVVVGLPTIAELLKENAELMAKIEELWEEVCFLRKGP